MKEDAEKVKFPHLIMLRKFLSKIFAVSIVIYIILAPPPHILRVPYKDILELLGYIMLVVAAMGRIWSLIYIAGKKSQMLVEKGPYSVVRNPLYVFNFIGAVGFGFSVENPFLALVIAMIFIFYYHWMVLEEEQQLLQQLGESYEQYMRRVPRWFPRVSQYEEAEKLTVEPKLIRNGIFDAAWFLWAFLLWEALEEFRAEGGIHKVISHLWG